MAALSSTSTFTSFPILNNKSPLPTITFPSNYNTHLPFPLSNSKRLNFSLLKAQKKDFPSNNFCEEHEAIIESYLKKYENDPKRKKLEIEKILSDFYDDEAWQLRRKKVDEKKEEVWTAWYNSEDKLSIENISAKLEIMSEVKFLDKLEAYRPLNLKELKDCFDDNIFFVTKVDPFQNGGIFYRNLRVPVDQALPVLEEKLQEEAGKEVDLFFRKVDKELELVTVLPKSQTDKAYEFKRRNSQYGYYIAAALSVTTLGTTALMSGFFLKPDATFDYYLANVLPLFGGFLTILGVSEIATRVTAAQYGVKLGPSFLVPSIWTGCLGVMNDYESRVPNRKAWFDIPVARTASAYLTSLSLIVAAFLSDGSLNGGDNPLYLRSDFFFNSPLVSLIQLINGDDLSNRLPYEVDGVGVTVDPLALAGLLGMIVTSLNLLPSGGLEGKRIVEAMFGRNKSITVSTATLLILLGTGVISGSVLFVAWGIFIRAYQSGSGVAATDGITPLGEGRYALGVLLALICFLTLFPNAAGTFSSWSLIEPYFRGFV